MRGVRLSGDQDVRYTTRRDDVSSYLLRRAKNLRAPYCAICLMQSTQRQLGDVQQIKPRVLPRAHANPLDNPVHSHDSVCHSLDYGNYSGQM